MPEVETRPATDITDTSAQLHGRVVDKGGSFIVEKRLEWGTQFSWDGFTSAVIGGDFDFYYDLRNLRPGTTYRFRAWARNQAGWGIRQPATFTTT